MSAEATACCFCGNVELAMTGQPITSIVCYCEDCQKGSAQIEALPNAQPVLSPDGGTEYLLYRKDRVRFLRGSGQVKSYKIRDNSATNRIVATCCNTAMLVKSDDWKPWVSVYRSRIRGEPPSLKLRIHTRFKPKDAQIPTDVPSYSTFPITLVMKLIATKVAMLLRL